MTLSTLPSLSKSGVTLRPKTMLPTVGTIDGTPRVSSLDIAEKFGKRHDDVLKTIKRIMADLDDGFRLRNFAETPQVNEQNGQTYPAYSLTRDAFSLLAMGFTGKAALAWKVKYIEAFNDMERMLRAPKSAVLTPFPQIRVLPPAQRQRLHELVLAKLAHTPAHLAWKARMSVWAAFNRRFQIPQYRLLPEDRMSEAMGFLFSVAVDPQGKALLKDEQLALPMNDMRQVAAALSGLIARAQSMLSDSMGEIAR